MPVQELEYQRGNKSARRKGRGIDPYRSRRGLALGANRFQRDVNILERRCNLLDKKLSCIREGDAAGGSIEETYAEARLELCYCMAQRRTTRSVSLTDAG